MRRKKNIKKFSLLLLFHQVINYFLTDLMVSTKKDGEVQRKSGNGKEKSNNFLEHFFCYYPLPLSSGSRFWTLNCKTNSRIGSCYLIFSFCICNMGTVINPTPSTCWCGCESHHREHMWKNL